jgi:glycosyltransferase involved in cell wall biosynthesis
MLPAIYTIAKNEAGNVEGFMEAAEGAPVYVLDTGSTDGTPELLRAAGAHVVEASIVPWRFDHARERALAMVPDDVDVCVSIDMDERLEAGWREKLGREWRGNIGNYRYIAAWADAEHTVPAVQSPRTRLHSRHGWEWHRAVHEVIRPLPGTIEDGCDTTIMVRHYQDGVQRNYAPLLSVLIRENPRDADARLQRAGEYMQVRAWKKALADYRIYLRLIDGDERPVIRYRRALTWIGIAEARFHLGDQDGTVRAFLSAVAAEPGCREAWVHVAHTMLGLGNAPLAYGAAATALSITAPPYYATMDMTCWGPAPAQIAEASWRQIQAMRAALGVPN